MGHSSRSPSRTGPTKPAASEAGLELEIRIVHVTPLGSHSRPYLKDVSKILFLGHCYNRYFASTRPFRVGCEGRLTLIRLHRAWLRSEVVTHAQGQNPDERINTLYV